MIFKIKVEWKKNNKIYRMCAMHASADKIAIRHTYRGKKLLNFCIESYKWIFNRNCLSSSCFVLILFFLCFVLFFFSFYLFLCCCRFEMFFSQSLSCFPHFLIFFIFLVWFGRCFFTLLARVRILLHVSATYCDMISMQKVVEVIHQLNCFFCFLFRWKVCEYGFHCSFSSFFCWCCFLIFIWKGKKKITFKVNGSAVVTKHNWMHA